jgi:glycosyltransferase involved in cell wall biosynthesis
LYQYAENFKPGNFKVYVNEENLGYIRNFEKVISLCTGDYIALCDQDDIWSLQKISLMVESIGDNILAYHDSEFIDETGRYLGKKVSDIRNCYSGNDSRVFLFENCVSGHAILFNKELLKYTDRFRKEIFHDWWLAYTACNTGSIVFIDKPLVKYRQHSSANTNILRQERTETIKNNSLQKMEKQLKIISGFSEYPYNKEQEFKTRLKELMEEQMTSYLNFSLAWFIFTNRKVLLYIQKKTVMSKLNFILKFLWGYKLKRLFKSE